MSKMTGRPNGDSPQKRLIDPNDINGLNMGIDTRIISTFWNTLEYYYVYGKRHWLMTAYILIVHLVGFSFCLLGFSTVFVIDMDIQQGTAAIMNPLCGLQTVFKCWTFAYSTREYLNLFAFFKKDFVTCVPPGKLEGVKIVVAENVDATNRFIKYAIRWNFLAVGLVSIMPFLKSQAFREFFHLGKGVIVPNKICDSSYPFEWNSSPTYEIIWFYEQIAVILAVVTSSAYQAILLFLVMALVGHLKVLGYVMENLRAKDFSKASHLRAVAAAKNNAYRQLMNCIKDHQKIIKAGDALAERYNTFLTFHLATAIIVGITAIFNCTIADEVADKIKFAIMCGYGLVEVAIYCLSGQLLENASEDVLRQVYLCEWEEMEPRFRQAAKLMMVRASRPISLRAGGLYRVNLETLGSIQQLVYSALTMLSTVVDKTQLSTRREHVASVGRQL